MTHPDRAQVRSVVAHRHHRRRRAAPGQPCRAAQAGISQRPAGAGLRADRDQCRRLQQLLGQLCRQARHRPAARSGRWSRSRYSEPRTRTCRPASAAKSRSDRRQHQGLLAQPEATAAAVHRRWLRPHRRHRLPRRGRISVHRRPQEGDHHPRRREHLGCRGGSRLLRLSRRRRSLGVRRADERLGEVPVAIIHLEGGRRSRDDGLRGFLDGRLAEFKSPERMIFSPSRCRASAPARSTGARSRPSTQR